MQTFSVRNLVRRRWTVIVAVLVVALVAFTVDRLHGIFGSHDAVSRPSADSLENTGYNPKRVLVEVLGSPGSVATINFLDVHAQPQRVADAPLPWSQLLTTDDPVLFADLLRSAVSGSGPGRSATSGIAFLQPPSRLRSS
jgi:hypothetical protein